MFRNKNRHSLQPVKKPQFSINAEEFPDITPSSASSTDTTKPQKSTPVVVEMDFKNCYKCITTGGEIYLSRNKDLFMESSKYINPKDIIYLFKLK